MPIDDPLLSSRVEPGRRHSALAMVKAKDDAQDETPRFHCEAFKSRLPWLIQLLVRESESHRRVDCPCGSCMVVSRGYRNSAKSPSFQTCKLQRETQLPHNGNQLQKHIAIKCWGEVTAEKKNRESQVAGHLINAHEPLTETSNNHETK